ncbi:MAG: hypothetical protein QOG09_1703 [Solirubrobacterales bacterium]|nr:hypothetical protein [Solirubrobacterales bacterium]MDX6663601.1 hypothetical protein [Solirubrobacterales bacterium]
MSVSRRGRGRPGGRRPAAPERGATRLAPMPAIRALVLASLLGLVTAGLVSCGGGSSDKLIPPRNAAELNNLLDQVTTLADNGSCDTAAHASDTLIALVQRLPASVDPRLRRNLLQGIAKLKALSESPNTCQALTSAPPPPPTPPPTTTATTPTTQTQTQTTPTTPTTPTDGGTGPPTDTSSTPAPAPKRKH